MTLPDLELEEVGSGPGWPEAALAVLILLELIAVIVLWVAQL